MAVITDNNKVSVGNSSTQVVPAVSGTRLNLVISNDSANDIYLAIGEQAVMNEGIRLVSGGTFVIEGDDKVNLQVNAISGSVGNNVSFFHHYLDKV